MAPAHLRSGLTRHCTVPQERFDNSLLSYNAGDEAVILVCTVYKFTFKSFER